MIEPCMCGATDCPRCHPFTYHYQECPRCDNLCDPEDGCEECGYPGLDYEPEPIMEDRYLEDEDYDDDYDL